MKVKIYNLGVIAKAEIDLKPLTVFIGRNATGKTWTAYTLASILGQHGTEKYLKAYLDKITQNRYPIIDNAIEQFLQEGTIHFDLVKFAEDYAETYINEISCLASSWMNNFLDTEHSNFEEMKVLFDLTKVKQKILDKIKNSFLDRHFSFGYENKNLLHIFKQKGENNIYFYIVSNSESNIFKKLPRRVFEQILFQEIFEILRVSIYSYIDIFPTERTAVVPFFSLGIGFEYDEDIGNLFFEKKSIQNAAVKSLMNMLTNVYLKTFAQRKEESKTNNIILNYIKLAELLENNILEGKVDLSESKNGKEILFKLSDNVKLEIAVTSSMVKELAPLVLYLRYLAEPDELLIIDEPEMNLHPAVQVEIIEFLAMLVQAGLNVLITTHSPYIVDHLANLMQAAKREDKEDIKKRFYLEKTEAFIPQEKVSVYLFEDGTAKNILNEEGRIDWGTFGDVSDDISHIFP
ncbi:Endonuclease GajA/Old nuclease/RecF-like AAA domain-containing protein [Nostoc sp. DSM 114161]|jgi:predicted ATPase|uniref:AAA family ATPase n=1 Tax=Nostoc sp. DSM 114161 TaxID=3440143 RepID=UPI0040451EAF